MFLEKPFLGKKGTEFFALQNRCLYFSNCFFVSAKIKIQTAPQSSNYDGEKHEKIMKTFLIHVSLSFQIY